MYRISLLFLGFFIISCTTTKQIEVTNESASYTKNNQVISKLQTQWEDKYITAKTNSPIPPGEKNNEVGRNLARDAAIVKCYADLYRQIGDVKITETVTVLNAVVNSHTKTELQGSIRGAKIIEDRWDENENSYKISMELKRTELIKYVKTWIDNGTVDPYELERAINTIHKSN